MPELIYMMDYLKQHPPMVSEWLSPTHALRMYSLLARPNSVLDINAPIPVASTWEELSPYQRHQLLCESPLCLHLPPIRPPRGFQTQLLYHGAYVRYPGTYTTTESGGHNFYYHPAKRNILDPLFAQFRDHVRGEPGDRLKYFLRRDQFGLIHQVGTEAILYGNIDQIRQTLGLEYHPHPTDPIRIKI